MMNWGPGLTDKPTWKTTALFVVLSWLGILFVFRGAVWGERIVSPLDIAASMYSKYKWIDPTFGAIPRNHYLTDTFDYELARVYVAHRGLRAREFPWWDPSSDGGGPLAAETHYGLTDPLRLLLFKTLPFVTAYNWIRILHSFLTGLGMFLLLRSLGFATFPTLLGALSFQFATIQSSFIYGVPPNSLPYYCFLWLALSTYMRTQPLVAIGLAGPLCAAILMSGTQQTHAYLVLFLGCFTVAYGSCFRNEIFRITGAAAGAFMLGLALAAPVFVPQIESFQLSVRRVTLESSPLSYLSGIFSLTGIFPWFTGSFRTLDLSKLLAVNGHQQTGMAYILYIGTAAMMVSVVGLLAGRKSLWAGNPHVRMAVLLIFAYLVVICSTPLLKIFYHRSGSLAVIGLTVMFAAGWDLLIRNTWRNAARIVQWMVVVLSIGVVLIHVFALAVYPRIKDSVLNTVLEKEATNPLMPRVPHLRRFQINNLPNEVTFRNPEPLFAFLGALCLLGLVKARQQRYVFASGVFVFNILPLLMFCSRATPSSPVKYWHALLAGGPEQKKVITDLGPNLRLKEKVPDRFDFVFPGTLAGLYGVHSLEGYVGLRPAAAGDSAHLREHNVIYESESRREKGTITVVNSSQRRFVWATNQNRDVVIVGETLNSIRLSIAAGPPGELVRTDTYYPGWHVESPASLMQRKNSDGFLAFSIPPTATDVVVRYKPSGSKITKPLSLAALAFTALLLASPMWRRSRPSPIDAADKQAASTQRV